MEIFKDLAIIILAAKLLGLAAKHIGVPQVVGEIVAGLLIGPSVLGLVGPSDYIAISAEIGVVILMFMAGLTTNIRDLIKTGPMALLIACVGVFVPLLGGTLLYSAFYGFSSVGSPEFLKAVFIGVILTATSVSITVETLKELGRLEGRIGTLITGAAIIDDVIGIIVLTVVISLKDSSTGAGSVLLRTALFLVLCCTVGVGIYYLFKYIDMRHQHQRRIPILGLALCLGMAYVAESFFGIADITGAYVAGIILCSLKDSRYINEKMDISSYIFFGPVFFASIGIKTQLSEIDGGIILFSVLFVLVGLITKIIGCGLTARLFRFGWLDSLIVGVGMMTRGEVALIISQKGLDVGLLEEKYFTSVILLIIVSSIITPIFLKLMFSRKKEPDKAQPVASKGV